MITLSLTREKGTPLRILCLGSHCDDIEIGCGGAVLQLTRDNPHCDVVWVAFSSTDERAKEGRVSAERFLQRAEKRQIIIKEFKDGFFPYIGDQIKEFFEQLKRNFVPDIILTHFRHDLHQDHRTISELTWNTFRNPLILEYEIFKYDGDLGSTNVFIHLDESICREKIEIIKSAFPSQKGRAWFDEETFWSLLRLRGVESNAPSRYAEGFYGRKIVF